MNNITDQYGVTFSPNKMTLIKCPKELKGRYEIPSFVLSIKDDAFSNCQELTSVTIPTSVTNIGWGAFENCTNLTSVTLQKGLNTIGSDAFSNCINLKEIFIPSTVNHIGLNSFHNCRSLTSIIVDEANPYYDSRNNCNAIIIKSHTINICNNTLLVACKNTIIPNSVRAIGEGCFENIIDFKYLVIPHSITDIQPNAFAKSSLECIVLNNSVEYIAEHAFDGCKNLKYIFVPQGTIQKFLDLLQKSSLNDFYKVDFCKLMHEL